jgi:hypothetical protein
MRIRMSLIVMVFTASFVFASTRSLQAQDNTAPSASPTQSADEAQNANGNKSGKTLEGCVKQHGSQYVLSKGGVATVLTGADVSSYVGQKVRLHGSYSGSDIGTHASADAGAGGNAFDVTSVDVISDTCKRK